MDQLQLFEDIALSNENLKKVGPYAYEYAGKNNKTLTVCALVHGNEIGGLQILFEVLKALSEGQITTLSSIRFIIGNPRAYELNKRFVETDLNRSFSLVEQVSYEQKRAREIESLLPGTSILIDFHQTLEPCHSPFFIFNFTEDNFRLARDLAPSVPIITFKSFGSSSNNGKGLSSTANQHCPRAITIETGEKGNSAEQTLFGLELVKRALSLLENESLRPLSPEISNCFTWGQIVKNENFDFELVKKLTNFCHVKKNEVLATNGKETILSELDGPVLFPKYDHYRKQSLELLRVLKPLKHLDELK